MYMATRNRTQYLQIGSSWAIANHHTIAPINWINSIKPYCIFPVKERSLVKATEVCKQAEVTGQLLRRPSIMKANELENSSGEPNNEAALASAKFQSGPNVHISLGKRPSAVADVTVPCDWYGKSSTCRENNTDIEELCGDSITQTTGSIKNAMMTDDDRCCSVNVYITIHLDQCRVKNVIAKHYRRTLFIGDAQILWTNRELHEQRVHDCIFKCHTAEYTTGPSIGRQLFILLATVSLSAVGCLIHVSPVIVQQCLARSIHVRCGHVIFWPNDNLHDCLSSVPTTFFVT